MKILVTGGAGFIGSAVVRHAVRAGHAVVNLDALTYAACLANVAEVADDPGYVFEEADIRDRAALDRIFAEHAPDAVMHLAAESHVDRSIDGPGTFVETNITGTYNMLEAARAHWERRGRPEDFRFHHISTDEVYGTLGATGQFTEATPYAPNSPYAASKAASDHLVRAWFETYGLPVVMTNCSNNYGPYHFPEKLIPVVILNALAGRPIPVYGAGVNVRDWLYVEDHAEALLLVVEKGELGRSYNIGGENEARNIDIVNTLCAILDRLRPKEKPYAEQIAFVADRPGHDLRYAIDPARIREELGWRPSVTLEEGLEKTVRVVSRQRGLVARARDPRRRRAAAGDRLSMGRVTIGDRAIGRENNFNLLRMLAASGVLVSHAYPISLGPEAVQPLQRWLDGHTLGQVSVYLFFAISGFFITQSFVRSASWRRFLAARALRLFPALVVVLGVTVVVAGTFLTTAPPERFWAEAPGYILSNLSLARLDYDLPGVFEATPYGTAINGSLWTLFYEVVCYMGVFAAGLLGLLSRPRAFSVALVLAIAACLAVPMLPMELPRKVELLADLALPFAIGSGFFVWGRVLPLSPLLALVLAGLAVAAHGTPFFHAALVLALSYGVFVAGYWPSEFLQRYNRLGDYSYGTYIYAFPIQQLVASSGVTDPIVNMALALPATIACAVVSWTLVERPALKLKPRRTRTRAA